MIDLPVYDWKKHESDCLPDGGIITGDNLVTHEDVIKRSKKLAKALRYHGIKQGDSIAILMRNDIDFIVSSLAASNLGVHAVPINWHFKEEELTYIISDANPKLLVAHEDLISHYNPNKFKNTKVLVVKTPDFIRRRFRIEKTFSLHESFEYLDDFINNFETDAEPMVTLASSMIYTSGTTGYPKGVKSDILTPQQRSYMRAINEKLYGIKKGMKTAIPAPLYHSAPNLYTLSAFKNKGLVVLMPKFDALELLCLIDWFKLTHLQLVPTMMLKMLRLPQEIKNSLDLSSLRHVVHAAAPCPVELKRQFIEWLSPIVYEYYGSTETGPVTFCDSFDWLKHPGAVGKPLDGVEIKILGDDKQEVPVGESGEVYVRNHKYPNFTYHNDDNKRQGIEEKGFVTVGDIGFLDDEGYLYLQDRKSHTIISGGVNIYPAEIEAALLSIAEVRDAVVLGTKDYEYGERVTAILELEDGANRDNAEEEIRNYLKAKIADYKIPRKFYFLNRLPRDENGKINKQVVRKLLEV